MRAVGYLRKSVVHALPGGQRTGGESWEQQEAAIRRLAEALEVDNLAIHFDWGQSGGAKNDRRRRGWQAVLGLIDVREVDVLLAYDEQRLSRSALSLLDLYQRCREAGVKIVLAHGGELDFSSAAGRFKLTVLAGVAQYQRDQASERSFEHANRRREAGEKLGEPFYGDDPTHPEQNYQRVLEVFREQGSFSGAARALNVEGLLSKRGKMWHARTVSLVVRHREPELAVRTIRKGSHNVSHHRFGGLVRCPCGGRMRPFAPTARPGYVSYRCYRASTLPGHVFPAAMNEKYLNVFWVVEMSRSYVMPGEVGQEDVLAAAKERRSRLIPLYDGGQIPKEELDARWAELTAEIDELEGADTPRMQAAREASMRELLERMYDPALFNVHLRKLWDSVECSVVNGKMVPVKVNWKDGIRPGPIDEGIAKVNARDAFTIGWFQHLGWLETPPAPPV